MRTILLMLYINPIICFIVGIMKPKANINGTVGYRSKNTRASQERWDYAQKLMKKHMLITAAIYFVIAIILTIVCLNVDMVKCFAISMSALLIEALGLTVVAVLLEAAMKRKFGPVKDDDEGSKTN